MRNVALFGIVLTGLWMYGTLAVEAEPEPGAAADTNAVGAAAVTNLISQLGDAQFAVREAATKKLAEMGEAAHPTLRQTLKLKELDPETAERVRGILRTADLAKTGRTTVTDPETGAVLKLDGDGKTVLATRDGKLLWKASFAEPGTGLAVENGILVIRPTKQKIDISTGRILQR
jgi:hypothetical protein